MHPPTFVAFLELYLIIMSVCACCVNWGTMNQAEFKIDWDELSWHERLELCIEWGGEMAAKQGRSETASMNSSMTAPAKVEGIGATAADGGAGDAARSKRDGRRKAEIVPKVLFFVLFALFLYFAPVLPYGISHSQVL